MVHEELSDEEQYRRAFLANDTAEDAVPKTFMDDAEMIWGRLHNGWNQEKVAKTFGFSQQKVSQYALLEKISPEARNIITTSLEQNGSHQQSEEVVENTTVVVSSPFSERLLGVTGGTVRRGTMKIATS